MLHIDWSALTTILPPQVATLFMGMIPIAEHRVSIPVAVTVFGLSWQEAAFYSVLGNIIPIIIVIYTLGPISEFASKYSVLAKRFFDWLFARTKKKYATQFQRWGALAVLLFVAIPLPLSGVYSGAVAAFIFGIPKSRSIPLIFAGMLISATIVTITTISAYALVT